MFLYDDLFKQNQLRSCFIFTMFFIFSVLFFYTSMNIDKILFLKIIIFFKQDELIS